MSTENTQIDHHYCHEGKHLAPLQYVCPMHHEVRSDQPGDCPKCGMHLVLEQEIAAQGALGKLAYIRDPFGLTHHQGNFTAKTGRLGDEIAERILQPAGQFLWRHACTLIRLNLVGAIVLWRHGSITAHDGED